VTVLKEDPYLLVREIPGFGFKRVDQVARKMGTPKEHPGRIRAGVVHSVVERLEEFAELGIDTFILSGYPHLEEAHRTAIADGVLPGVEGGLLTLRPAGRRTLLFDRGSRGN